MSNGAAEAPKESPVPVSRHDDLVALEPDGALSCHNLLVSSDPSSSLGTDGAAGSPSKLPSETKGDKGRSLW